MRTGANPAKAGIPAYSPQDLGVALIVYIPFLQGYYANALEILTYQLESLRAATPVKYDVLVFDNGSCQEARTRLKTLQEQGWIDWLILSSHNMGKAGAWNWIFGATPSRLICYADSDVLFRPGWYEASLAILEAFPLAGMIGAQPNFYDVMQGESQLRLTMDNQEGLELVEYWPEKAIIDEYCLGIGATDEIAAPFYQKPLASVIHQKSSTQAVIGASHMQFLIPRQVARQVTPLPATKGLLRKETMSLDFAVDRLGYQHLSTTRPFVFHMGNTISDQLLEKVQAVTNSLPLVSKQDRPRRKGSTRLVRLLSRLATNPRLKPYLVRFYNALFQVLYLEMQKK
jgi:glycosyltransferase involved in cell wall biosynthesis